METGTGPVHRQGMQTPQGFDSSMSQHKALVLVSIEQVIQLSSKSIPATRRRGFQNQVGKQPVFWDP